MQKAENLNGASIISVKGNDYRIYFFYMSKDEVINLLSNANLTKKKQNIIKHKNLLSCIKRG